jgi:hypothetical protein
MKIVPLFGNGIESYSAVATAQRRLNCFYDPRADNDKDAAIIRGTPGSLLWITLPTAPIRGFHVVQNTMYVVAYNALYSVNTAGTATQLGTITSTSGRVELADNGEQLAFVDGSAGYVYDFTTLTLTKIADSNFPNTCATIAFLNGRFIVEKVGTRQFYASALYDGLSWSPLIFATKENESSVLLAVEILNGTLMLWGANGIEFWQDVGATPLPYQRINGASQSWGLAAIASRAQLNNTEIFLGQNPQGHLQVLMINGYTPTRVSTTDVEHIISTLPTFSDAVALTYMIDGHPMYQLTFPTGNLSLLFDSLTGLWSETQTGVGLTGRHFGQYGIVFNVGNYISDATTGNIYTVTDSVYTDNGVPIKRQVRTRHIRMDGNTFGISELYLDIETGVGLQAGQGVAPTMMIRRSKDGGRTYGIERHVSMGAVGQYINPRVISRRWGMARDFVFEFTVSDPIKFVLCDGSISVYGEEGSA